MNANTRNDITTAIDTTARRYNALLGNAYEAWPIKVEDKPRVWQLMNDWYRTNKERILCWSSTSGVFFIGV